MFDMWSKKEWDELNRTGIKELKKQERYKNRFNIYACITSTLAIIIAAASLVCSIISLTR